MDNLATDNPAGSAADNPGTEPAATSPGTGTDNGQAQGGAPDIDIFKGVDPAKLPPELKQTYDGMLRDYRDKTSKLSETIKSERAKAAEAYKQKADFYDQVTGQEEFVKLWNDHVQKVNGAATATEGDPKLAELTQKFHEIEQKLQVSEMAQVTEAFAEAVNDKGERLHPEFDKLNDIVIGNVGAGDKSEPFSLLRGCIELATGNTPQEKLSNGYKAAEAIRAAIFEEGRKAGLGRLQAKIQNGSQPPTDVTGNLSITEKRPKTAREALEMAKKGMMVSRS